MPQDVLTDKLLIAMPDMPDDRFDRTIILMCEHGPSGAMGLVLNRVTDHIGFTELLQQLGIGATPKTPDIPIYEGGPVEPGRGFVLHSTDYLSDASLRVGVDFAVSANTEILEAIARGDGPRFYRMLLGYAGWGPGQLDDEMQANGWLHVAGDPDLVFRTPPDEQWDAALGKLGIDLASFSGQAGHA